MPSGLASRSSIGLLKHPSFQMDSYDSRSDSVKNPKNVNADLHLSEKKVEKRKTSKEEIKKLVGIMQGKMPSKADLLEK